MGLCTFTCMVWLHVGTYYYVQQMLVFEDTYVRRNNTAELIRHDNVSFEPSFANSSWDVKQIGSLHDPVSKLIGFADINIAVLDLVASAFPVLFLSLSVLLDDLACWTKVMICHGFLALGKGLFSFLTVVPDSAGWDACKARLGPADVAWMRSSNHTTLDFIRLNLAQTRVGNMRWCADMMWSGHTYITTLYAIGAVELTTNACRTLGWAQRAAALMFVTFLALFQQSLEIYFVLLNRFHYTTDIVMAVVLTFLLYMNGSIAMCAKCWRNLFVSFPRNWTSDIRWHAFDRRKDDERRIWETALNSSGTIYIPFCCSPRWFQSTRQHIFTDDDLTDLMMMLQNFDKDWCPFTQKDYDGVTREMYMPIQQGVCHESCTCVRQSHRGKRRDYTWFKDRAKKLKSQIINGEHARSTTSGSDSGSDDEGGRSARLV